MSPTTVVPDPATLPVPVPAASPSPATPATTPARRGRERNGPAPTAALERALRSRPADAAELARRVGVEPSVAAAWLAERALAGTVRPIAGSGVHQWVDPVPWEEHPPCALPALVAVGRVADPSAAPSTTPSPHPSREP